MEELLKYFGIKADHFSGDLMKRFMLFLFGASRISWAVPASVAGSPQVPFAFVENRGQAPASVRFTGEGTQFKAWFEDTGVKFQQGSAVVRMSFAGGSNNPEIQAAQPLGATANYLRGRNSQDWQTGLPMFGSIYYREVWAGIDVRFLGEGGEAKTEYLVSPGASLDQIRLRFDGHARIGKDGSLLIENGSGRYREQKPVLYQENGTGRRNIRGSFRKNDDGTIGFLADLYDTTKPLTVDPVILFSGYFGGASQTTITAVAVNSNYDIIVGGWTASTDLPASGGVRTTYAGQVDGFIAEFSPAGGALIFCTYLGGSADDRVFGLTVDSSNNIYVTGQTSSTNFPVSGAFQQRLSGSRDAFVAKLSPAGNSLVFSTYLGGSGVDVGNGIALDSLNEPVVVGDTNSSNLSASSSAFQRTLNGSQNVFVAKVAADGHSLIFLTYLGGNAVDHGAALKVDASNAIFLGGSTTSYGFPVYAAFQPHSGGGQDGFVVKLSSDGRAMTFGSFYGGSGGSAGAPEEVNSLAIGPGGNLIAAGTTSSNNFPVTAGVVQQSFGGGMTDGFVGKMNGSTGALLKSTYLGGSGDDGINALAIDATGDLYMAGYTSSEDFPTQNAIQSSNGGGLDAFVVKATFLQVIYSTYLGGSGNDSANALALDSLTSLVVAGTTGSSSFPNIGKVGAWPGTQLSSFVTKIVPGFTAAAVSEPNYLFDVWHDTGYSGSTLTLNGTSFGLPGDIPISGDWNGTGARKIGVFRNGTWLLDVNGDGVFDAGDKTVVFGQAGDIPVVGDWNGTGSVKLGVFRSGTFILDLSGHLTGVPTGLNDASFVFGLPGDLPICADWNQSGTTKVGVFRSGTWLIDYNGNRIWDPADKTYTYGQAGDIPLVGDWDGSGLTKIGVYRSGVWILDYLGYNAVSSYELIFAFGGSVYIPLLL